MNNATKTVYKTITPAEFQQITGYRFSLSLVKSLVDDEDYFQDMQDIDLYQFELAGKDFSFDSYLNEIEVLVEEITATYI